MEAIIFIGIQASGKSTLYVKRFSRTHLRINLDMLKTRNRENIILDACIKAGQSIVIDNTNPTKEDRKKYMVKLKPRGFKIIGYYLKASVEDCLARNALRVGKERIPDAAIVGTYNRLALPEYSEGFDELYAASIEGDDFEIESWKDEV